MADQRNRSTIRGHRWTRFSTRWIIPVGERASRVRRAGRATELRHTHTPRSSTDEIGTLPLEDPQTDDLFVEAIEHGVSELPVIPLTEAAKIVPFDTTSWTNWRTARILHACGRVV